MTQNKKDAGHSEQQNPKTAPTNEDAGIANRDKDPADWVTGDEPMTGAQASYLKTLSEQHKEPFDDSLSKGDASRKIDSLRKQAGM